MWLQQTEKALERWWENSWCSEDCHLVKHGLESAQAIKTLISAVLAEWTSRLCMDTDWSTSLKVSITQDVDWQDGNWHRKHMPTQTQWHAAGEDQLCLLGFHQRLSGKEMCLCFLTASRDLFVNVTLVKSSATVSPVDAIFSLEQKKNSRCKLQNNSLIFILFYSLDDFLVICRQNYPKIGISTAVLILN